MSKNPFRYFKTSSEVIQLGVMMYVRFPLSLRNVEDLLHEGGIDVCHESVRLWGDSFGTYFAHKIRKRRSGAMRQSPQWQWHLTEIFVKIRGERHHLWRAVYHEGEVLESCVTKTRDKAFALKFLKKEMIWPASQQSRREFALTVSKPAEGHISNPAHAKFAEVHFNVFVSIQSLQLRKTHQHQSSV